MKTFCHLCGAKYLDGKSQPWECSGCGNRSYENPKPAANIALIREDGKVLIAERGVEPAKGKFSLPGGFLEPEETFEVAAVRELEEELGLKESDYGPFKYVTSVSAPYWYSRENYSVSCIFFVARLVGNPDMLANDDIASYKFVPIEELGDYEFSMQAYPEIIRRSHKTLH